MKHIAYKTVDGSGTQQFQALLRQQQTKGGVDGPYTTSVLLVAAAGPKSIGTMHLQLRTSPVQLTHVLASYRRRSQWVWRGHIQTIAGSFQEP